MSLGRKGPQRRCLGCGLVSDKGRLARFTVTPAGEHWSVVRDDSSTLPGRGLYVCFKRACFERARARGAFARGARVPAEHLAVDVGLARGLEGEA